MAQLTITVPDAQVPRVQTAFGAVLDLRDGNGDLRDATADEVRQYLVDKLKQIVRLHESQEATETAVAAVVDVDATI